jgi:hypothetical protein
MTVRRRRRQDNRRTAAGSRGNSRVPGRPACCLALRHANGRRAHGARIDRPHGTVPCLPRAPGEPSPDRAGHLRRRAVVVPGLPYLVGQRIVAARRQRPRSLLPDVPRGARGPHRTSSVARRAGPRPAFLRTNFAAEDRTTLPELRRSTRRARVSGVRVGHVRVPDPVGAPLTTSDPSGRAAARGGEGLAQGRGWRRRAQPGRERHLRMLQARAVARGTDGASQGRGAAIDRKPARWVCLLAVGNPVHRALHVVGHEKRSVG